MEDPKSGSSGDQNEVVTPTTETPQEQLQANDPLTREQLEPADDTIPQEELVQSHGSKSQEELLEADNSIPKEQQEQTEKQATGAKGVDEIGSSVDPDENVLIALASSKIVNNEKKIDEIFDEKDGDALKGQEADTFTDITSDDSESLCDRKDDFDIDERNESETSEIIFIENLLDASETSENPQPVQEEVIIGSANLTQETGIFITQTETKKERKLEIEEMPEKREEEVVSPTLQRANLRFRWGRTIPVTANDVVFFSSHKREDPLKLTWSEGTDCFYSKDMEVPTGVYKGTLVIDQKSYPIEEITVKHYTFEADLYIKDDIIEDNFNIGQPVSPRNTENYGDLNKSADEQRGLNFSEKIEDIIRQQMTSTDTEQLASKSDYDSGRRTPVGDVGKDTYQDGLSSLNNSYNKNFNTSVVEDEIEQSFDNSQHSSKPHTSQPSVEEIIENTLRCSGSQEQKTPDASAEFYSKAERRTPADIILNRDNVDDSFGYKSPSATYSVHSSARQTPQKDYVSDILDYEPKSADGLFHSFEQSRTPTNSDEGSRQGSARHTPLDDDVAIVPSPVGSYHGLARQTPQQTSANSSARQTPQPMSESLRASQEKMYGSHGSLPSLHSSLPGHGGSRPQSLTSEQELTQYFEQSSRKVNDNVSVGSNKTPMPQQYMATNQVSGSRPQSTSSLPVITTQQRLLAEKRSMTPDNYIRVPGSTSSPVARPPSVSKVDASSRASSRTITPANGVENQFSVDTASLKRIEDLEDTVRNLRKLLSAREQEVHELTDQVNDVKDINRTLQDEVHHCRQKHSGTPRNENFKELERRYSSLAEEKEILAQEVVKLKDHISDLQRQVERNEQPDGETHPSLSSYDPNNPNALQRKIADLQSHVQDLHEANESAASELDKAERKISELMKQNDALKTSQNVGQQDLQSENRRLHDKISKLWEQGYGDTDHKTRVENQQLRDDNRATRERNYKLHEENLKLKEEITELRKVLERQATEPKLSRTSINSLDRDHFDKYSSLDRSKLPDISAEKLIKTSLTMLNGHIEQKPVLEKEGHRYGYRQSKEEKLYSTSPERDILKPYSSHVDSPRFTSSMEKSDPYLRSHVEKDSYRRSYDQDALSFRDIGGKDERSFKDTSTKDESRFRSSLERAEAKLRSSLEKNSYLDQMSPYESNSRGSDRHKMDRNFMPEKSIMERSRTPDRLKPDTYRSKPDGISDKDERSLNQQYSLTSERLPSHKLDTERRLDYGLESRSLASIDRDYKTLTASYPELNRVSPSTSTMEKSKELSQSEVDLRPKRSHSRSRSRSPERHAHICSDRSHSHNCAHGLPPAHQTGFRFRNIKKRHMPQQAYTWDGRFACAQCGSHLVKHSIGLSRNQPSCSTEPYLRDSEMSRYRSTRPRTTSHMAYTTQDYYSRDYDYYRTDKKSNAYQSDGYESDTATDILVSAQPYEQRISPTSSPEDSPSHRGHQKYHRRSYSQRRDSLGSDGSSIEDVEESFNKQRLHSRSKSADGRELLRRTEPMGGSGRTPQKTDRLSLTTGDPGFRTVTPSILHTQHNRTVDRGQPTNLTSGMRPFAPRTPGDINIEDVVKFSRQGGKLSQGKVKFVGHLPGRSDIYLGVELDKEDGKHDGTFEGVRYYQCKPSKGVFVAFNKVVMAWAPNL